MKVESIAFKLQPAVAHHPHVLAVEALGSGYELYEGGILWFGGRSSHGDASEQDDNEESSHRTARHGTRSTSA